MLVNKLHDVDFEVYGCFTDTKFYNSVTKSLIGASEVFCKNGVLKIFAIFTRKHLRWSLFAGLQVSCGYCEVFKNIYFELNQWKSMGFQFRKMTYLQRKIQRK